MFIYFNPNPAGRNVGDCAVRAIAKALSVSWEEAYDLLAQEAFDRADMPSSDSVIGALLREHGFYRYAVPNTCPDCYTAADFARDHPRGTYVLFFGSHVCTIYNGNVFDSWDSSAECPQYFWSAKLLDD